MLYESKPPFSPRSPFLGLLLFGVSLGAITHELREYHYRDVLSSLGEIPTSHLLLALGLTLLNYFMLTGYDTLATRTFATHFPTEKPRSPLSLAMPSVIVLDLRY